MREIQRKFDSEEELDDIVLKCDNFLHSKGYRTTVKPNRIEYFQKLKFGEFAPLIALINGIGEGTLIFKKESDVLKIEIRQKLLLFGFLTVLVFAMLGFLLTLIKDKGFHIQPILIAGAIVILLALTGVAKSIHRTRKMYKLLNELL